MVRMVKYNLQTTSKDLHGAAGVTVRRQAL